MKPKISVNRVVWKFSSLCLKLKTLPSPAVIDQQFSSVAYGFSELHSADLNEAACASTPTPINSASNGSIFLMLAVLFLLIPSQHVQASYNCLIEPTQTVELASPVTGLLEKVTVKRGDRVSKGQVIAQLDARAEQASADLSRYKSEQAGPLVLAENKVEFAHRKFERRRQMASEKLMAGQERDDAESEYKLADSERQVAQENREIARIEYRQQSALLALRTIRSPFDGVVVDQLAFPGEVVEPGANKKTIVKLAQLDPLRIHVILPKEMFGALTVGEEVEVIPEIPANGKYKARIKSIDRLIDAASGTFVAYLEMPNPKLATPAGVSCKASFSNSSKSSSPSGRK
jgi:RND family efflux transporter MFP subunit